MRRRVVVVAVVLFVLLAVPAGWYLGSPLFISKTVEEQFPRAANATVPGDMTRAQVEEKMATTAKTDSGIQEEMPKQRGEPALLLEGMFQGVDSFHQGEGIAKVYRLADGSRILRLEDFKVTNGPDLFVILTKHPDPKRSEDVRGQGYEEVAKLKGNIGSQNYPLPQDLDLAQYQAVVIYCKPFHVVFSVASFAQK